MKRIISFVCSIAVITTGILAFESVSSTAVARGEEKRTASVTETAGKPSVKYATKTVKSKKLLKAADKKLAKKKSAKKLKHKKTHKASKKPRTRKISTRFKVTFYSGDTLGYRGAGGKLTPKESVAMNRSQMNKLGLKYGDKIYIKSKRKGWSGWYEIRDCGCSSGVIDIFVAKRSNIPSWGVERDVTIEKQIG